MGDQDATFYLGDELLGGGIATFENEVASSAAEAASSTASTTTTAGSGSFAGL